MKKIVQVEIQNPFTGESLTQPTGDVELVPEEDGGDGKMRRPVQEPLTTIIAIRTFLNAAFRDPPPTMDESSKAMSIMRAMKRSRDGGFDFIELDDDHHSWLLSQFDQKGPKVYGINAAVVRDTFRLEYTEPEVEAGRDVVEASA